MPSRSPGQTNLSPVLYMGLRWSKPPVPGPCQQSSHTAPVVSSSAGNSILRGATQHRTACTRGCFSPRLTSCCSVGRGTSEEKGLGAPNAAPTPPAPPAPHAPSTSSTPPLHGWQGRAAADRGHRGRASFTQLLEGHLPRDDDTQVVRPGVSMCSFFVCPPRHQSAFRDRKPNKKKRNERSL